jgi:hypothetical protein
VDPIFDLAGDVLLLEEDPLVRLPLDVFVSTVLIFLGGNGEVSAVNEQI